MKKKMKKSFLLPLIGIIAVITIVGVGFAAWAIISPINIDAAEGTITAEELTDRTFTINATQNDDTKNIHFGKGTVTTLPTDAWFRDDGSSAGNLSTTITITLTPTNWDGEATINQYLEGRTINVKLATDDFAGFKTAIDAGYLVIPTLTCGEKTSTLTGDWTSDNLITLNLAGSDFTKGESSYTATVTVTFAWGTATEGKDPYTYFNQVNDEGKAAVELTEANINLAKAVCDTVYALNSAKYTVSFEKVDAPVVTE